MRWLICWMPFLFDDGVYTLQMSGTQILGVLEQSLSLERGIMQLSGMQIHYNLQRPRGKRVLKALINGKELLPEQIYEVATVEIMAKGGDLYKSFLEAKVLEEWSSYDKVLQEYFTSNELIRLPQRGRQIAE